jgi:ribosome biogenesis GTPase
MDKKHLETTQKNHAHEKSDNEPIIRGQVLAFYGRHALVEMNSGASVFCSLSSQLPILVPGDWVFWQQQTPEEGVITALEERDQVLSRPQWDGSLKIMAANVSQMAVIFAPCPEPDETLLDSYCVAAEHSHIKPLLILNKSDLLSPSMPWQAHLEAYQKLGYKGLVVNTRQPAGLDELALSLQGEVTIFVGPSGVGKSSLIQSLIPKLALETNELKRGRYGKHTTSRGQLYHLAQGGSLIDSPGIRRFGLWHLSRIELAWGFIEFRPYIGQCQFRNCIHQHEPGCAILEAVQRGDISAHRLHAFQKLATTPLK